MDNKENLSKFIDAVIADQEGETGENFHAEYLKNKARDIVSELRRNSLREDAFNRASNGKITLRGDDVLVNGKLIGTIKSDLNDINGGINFVSADGKFSKEFDDVTALYQFIAQKFAGVKESVTASDKVVKKPRVTKK